MEKSMFYLLGSVKRRNSDTEAASYHDHDHKVAAQLEEELHGPSNKRCKPSSPSQQQIVDQNDQQWDASNSNDITSNSPNLFKILDEPGPLGLKLRKSPSFVELIQMRLAQESGVVVANVKDESNLNSEVKKVKRGAASSSSSSSGSAVKHKASNFPASLLRIGSWEYKSQFEGDLVAKCYYAKNKLVWEVLEGELKSKIEIQWSEIMALKADFPVNGPSSLTVVLARPPIFYIETNPQPKRHTVWQETSDFTDGQASDYRLHFLQCPQGVLTRHFEKLIQSDARLNFLSRQPEIIMRSPYFDGRPSAYKNLDNLKDHDLHQVNGKGSSTTRFQDIGSSHSVLLPSFKIEQNGPPGSTLDNLPCEESSASSAMDRPATEGNSSYETDSQGTRNLYQIQVPGLRRSMSVSDFIGHIEHCLSEEMIAGNPSFSDRRPGYQEMLDGVAQHLLNDNQVTEASSDEKSLMSRVNSLRCLLQKDPAAVLQNPHVKASAVEGPEDAENIQGGSHDHEPIQDNRIETDVKAADKDLGDVSDGKQAPGMTRKDSYTELLFNLPRITSLPKFLSNISEDDR